MQKYKPGSDVGTLERWTFDNPASDYLIIEGNPQTSGRIDAGGAGHTTRFGIWRCTKGAFKCTEQGDELMTVLSGRCQIVNHSSNEIYVLGPGDSLFIHDGSRVTWIVTQDVTKVFYGHKSDGY